MVKNLNEEEIFIHKMLGGIVVDSYHVHAALQEVWLRGQRNIERQNIYVQDIGVLLDSKYEYDTVYRAAHSVPNTKPEIIVMSASASPIHLDSQLCKIRKYIGGQFPWEPVWERPPLEFL